MKKFFKKFIKKILKFFIFIILLSLSLIQGLIYFASKDDFKKEQDYALVLGAKVNKGEISKTLEKRLDAAYKYLKEHKKTKAILCGGKEKNDNFSQSYYMKKYLLNKGIGEKRLILEEKSKNTFQNIKFALFKMEKKPSSVMIISSDYHIFRAKLILRRFGVLGYSYPAKVPKGIKIQSNIRETFAVIKTFIFDRPTSLDIKKLHLLGK